VHSFHGPAYAGWIRYLDLPAGPDEPDTAPVCVYLAGLGSAATADFPEIVTRPALRGRRSLLVDLAGTGWSDPAPASFGYTIEEHADVIAALLDSSDLKGCHVVGHSLGGSVAISLATRRPDQVGRLVVAEPNLDPGVGTLSRHIADQSEDAFVSRGYSALRAVVARDEEAAGVSVFHATTGRWSPTAMYRSAVSLLADRTPTFRDLLASASMPRAMLVGERSDDVDLRTLVDSGVTVHVVPGAGHAMTHESPEEFAHTIAAALAR
jgi:pimeloyl-ACP methyl ester carboxylesterase